MSLPKRTLEDIYSLGMQLLVPQTPEETYKKIAENAIRLFGGKYSSIFLIEHGIPVRVYTTSSVLFNVHPRRKGVIVQSMTQTFPFAVSVRQANPKLKEYVPGIQSVISVPLMNVDTPFGVLTILTADTHIYSDEELHLFNIFGLTASLVIIKNRQYRDLMDSLEKRDTFISVAAHELRTPLTVIKTYSQLIQKRISDTAIPDGKWSDALNKEINRMTNLVNDILEVEHIRTGKMTFDMKRVSIAGIIAKAVENFRITFRKDPVLFSNQLKRNRDAFILGDEEKLMQVIINLVNNAVKYSPDAKPVRIVLKRLNGEIVISVRDTGIGIPAGEIPKIFGEFYKVNQTRQGLGLGLFIAKTIVERHHGRIEVTSKPGQGSVFSVFIPEMTLVSP